ncbi:helix-turn-helix domain-containing protein [Streptomyces sp. NPDC015220]|uniref:helix-turn-helix domain-containing protein n=1 Tax=Streptomyces sp. NPDC015220 TaxID=3364947 RepID=UPI0036FF2212
MAFTPTPQATAASPSGSPKSPSRPQAPSPDGPQGGGLTPERQAFRGRIRLEAAERIAAGASNTEVAEDLRVGVRSVRRRRRAWHDAGTEGLRPAGPVSRPRDG